jgi:hypothetical protein
MPNSYGNGSICYSELFSKLTSPNMPEYRHLSGLYLGGGIFYYGWTPEKLEHPPATSLFGLSLDKILDTALVPIAK